MNDRKQGRSLEVPGVSHGNAPIPMGARVGNVIYSSGIMGKDPATDTLPPGVEDQVRFAYDNLLTLLKAGGATTDDLVRLTVYIRDDAARAPINAHWLRLFPDPHDRPARHTLKYDLPNGMLVQFEAVAVIRGA